MNKIIKNSFSLFAGFGLIMIAHGLQANLLGVRAVIEDFNFISTGIVMSGYFIGFFVGSIIVPNLVYRVGHIRVFAAFASLASLSILIHSIYVNPIIWTLARFLTGFSLIGIFIITESWLNDRANNRTRGKLLSIYMIVTFVCVAGGSLLLNFSSPKNYEPFILISLLLSLALVPILLTKRKAPKFKKLKTMKLNELYKASPLGVISSFFTGSIHSAIFTLIAVYAASVNFSIFEISLLLFLITIAGALAQWPIGYLSDKYDRRLIIIMCTILGTFFALACIYISGNSLQYMYLSTNVFSSKLTFFIFVILYAGMSLPLYSLNLAHTNDFIPKEKFVAAGGGLQIVFSIGSIGGPILCSAFMYLYGPNGFFIFLGIFHFIIFIFGIYRITRRSTEDNPDSTFTPLPRNITPLGIELDPNTGADLSNTDKK